MPENPNDDPFTDLFKEALPEEQKEQKRAEAEAPNKQKTSDFIEDLKNEILKAMPDVCPDWAEYCSIAPLSTILHNAVIVEKEKSLKMNLLMMMVGYPGCKKSLPMFTSTYPIIRRLCDELDMDLLIPSRYTVEGLINHINRGGQGEIRRRNVGIIIRDEFSGLFKQLRKADWQSDGMEFISEMYDGIFQRRVTSTHGLHIIENLHASMLTATTPYFLSKMDPEFFIQGTGNRFLYCCMTMKEYKAQEVEDDYFNEDWDEYKESKISGFVDRLVRLYRREIKKIYIGVGADKLWIKYKKQCEDDWKKQGEKEPLGWVHHPIKRYPELALKLAGIYAISNRADIILKMPDEKWDNSVGVEKKHMERAIATVERNREHFKKIVHMKEALIPRSKPESLEDEARALLPSLRNSKYEMLNAGEWYEQQDITHDNHKFQQLRRILVNKELVKKLTWNDLTSEDREKLDITSHSVTVYKCIDK